EFDELTEPERLVARLCRVVDARDWEGTAGCFAEDFQTVDRRRFGGEPARGQAEAVHFYRTLIETSPDLELRSEFIAGDGTHMVHRVGCYVAAAREAGGDPMEQVMTLVSTVCEGRYTRVEQYDAGDEQAALAAWER